MGDDPDPHAGTDPDGDESPPDDAHRQGASGDAGVAPSPGPASSSRADEGGGSGETGATDATRGDRAGGGTPDDHDRPSDERLETLFADLWETLEENGDPAALSAYLSAITAGDYGSYSDREVFEYLLDSVFAPGQPWTDYEVYRSALHAALGDFRRVAGYDEDDVARISDNPALDGDVGRVRVAVVNARRFASVVHEFGSFAAYLDLFGDDGERAVRGIGHRFALGPRGVREFLGNLGYRPVVRRERSLGRTLARVGVVSAPRAYDEIEDAVSRIGDLTHRRWTVVDRVFWCHGFGPDVVGLGGPVCGDAPNCWACLVGDCDGREDPIERRQ